MIANKSRPAKPLYLTENDWPSLAQAVKEQLVLHMQRKALQADPVSLRLVVSLRLIAGAHLAAHAHCLNALANWLALQCRHIEVTASRQETHKLYIEEESIP